MSVLIAEQQARALTYVLAGAALANTMLRPKVATLLKPSEADVLAEVGKPAGLTALAQMLGLPKAAGESPEVLLAACMRRMTAIKAAREKARRGFRESLGPLGMELEKWSES